MAPLLWISADSRLSSSSRESLCFFLLVFSRQCRFRFLLASHAFVPLGEYVLCMFRAGSRCVFGVVAHPLFDRGRPYDGHCKVVVPDVRCFPIGIQDRVLSMLRCVVLFGRPSAAVDRGVDSVSFAHVPLYFALAIEVRGSPSPRAVRAVNDTVAAFDLELHLYGIDVSLAGGAC